MKERALVLLVERKFTELRELLEEMNPTDIAALLEQFPHELLPVIFRLLPKELAADTFVEMDTDLQQALIDAFTDLELKEVIDKLFVDDMVDIIDEMPANVVKRVLQNSSNEKRRMINEVLNYSKDSAGSVMTTEYVDLKADMTVEDAFKRIKRTGLKKETIYTCYVTDDNRTLLGVITAKDLMLAEYDETVGELMETNIIYANTTEDKEEAATKFRKYDLLAIPVVDKELRLIGIITVDDAIDVMQEAAEEDFARMAAIQPLEDSYFKTSVFQHVRKRVVWLLILMLSATITGAIITHYEEAFAAVPILVAFIPMLMDTGGNCGSQASTTIIRGMALDEIRMKDFFKVLSKEFFIGLLIGLILAVVNSIRVFIMYNSYEQSVRLMLVTGITLLCATVIAKLLGCILPMLAKKLKLDPAIMASPLLTTICDAFVIFIFFNIALVVMNMVV
jgi:Mg2+ transporter (mgtE)